MAQKYITSIVYHEFLKGSKRTYYMDIYGINMTPPIEPHGLIQLSFGYIFKNEFRQLSTSTSFKATVTTNTRKT